MATTPNIVNVFPAPGAVGIVLSEKVSVTFNQEMDETTINTGTFVVMGKDKTTSFSPVDIIPFDVPGLQEEEINTSPYVTGYIKGTISFQKVNSSGVILDDSTKDYTGAGDNWLTVAIFTPNVPFESSKEYTVLLAGDETPTDAFNSGIKTRTVFDTLKTSGSGTASLIFDGGYTGTNNRSYTVKFITSGAIGSAEYEWWDNNDPLTVYSGISSTGDRELEDGLFVYCEPDGVFTVGDTFTVVCVPSIPLASNYRWTFNTGTGSILIPPSSFSTSGIIATAAEAGTSPFYVSSIIPEDKEYGVQIEESVYIGNTIILTFSEDIDDSTVTEDTLLIYSEVNNGDPLNTFVTGDLAYEAEIENNVITITLDPGQLYQNNIVVIKLLEAITSINSNTLSSDQYYYFSTPYSPLYTGIRRIQLDLGRLIADIPEETIMLAIYEASLAADQMSFTTTHTNQQYFEFARREFTNCYAEALLLKGLTGDSSINNRLSKKLGDLAISRGPADYSLKDRLKEVQECIARWQVPLQSGGLITPGASLLPQVAVKGCNAEDAIYFNRQWEEMSKVGLSKPASNSTDSYFSGRRRLRTFRNR